MAKIPYQILTKSKFKHQETDEGMKYIAVTRVYNGKKYGKYERVPKDSDKFKVAERLYAELLELYPFLTVNSHLQYLSDSGAQT